MLDIFSTRTADALFPAPVSQLITCPLQSNTTLLVAIRIQLPEALMSAVSVLDALTVVHSPKSPAIPRSNVSRSSAVSREGRELVSDWLVWFDKLSPTAVTVSRTLSPPELA